VTFPVRLPVNDVEVIELNPVPVPPVIVAVPSVKLPPVTAPLNVAATPELIVPELIDKVPSVIVGAVNVPPVLSFKLPSASVLPASSILKLDESDNAVVLLLPSPFNIIPLSFVL